MRHLKSARREPEPTPDEAAVAWFVRLQSGPLGARDHRRFEIWRSAPEHAESFARVQLLWRGSEGLAARPEILHLREASLAGSAPRRRYALVAIAAGIIAAIVSGVFLVGQDPRAVLHESGLATLLWPAPDQGGFSTEVGERSTITLRDGSVLTLNTDSAARVNYSTTERAITLLRGQALFEVAKGVPRPFVVTAGDRRITATGTAFDVRLDEAAVEVTLVEGHVVVDQLNGPAADSPKAMARAELQPGQRMIAKHGAPVSVAATNVEHVTSWTSGKLVFLDARLADAISEVNRYTRTPITLADGKLSELRVNGVFRTGQPIDFANALTEVYPVAISRLPDEQILISSKLAK